MDELTSLGLRVDENENLRIIPKEIDEGSTSISKKIKLLLAGKFNMLNPKILYLYLKAHSLFVLF